MTAYLNVDEPLTGTIIGNDPICEGNVAVMNAGSFEASAYSWMKADSTGLLSGPLVSTALDSTTLYLLHMTRGMCETDTTYEVKVTSNPRIERVDSVGIRSRMIVMTPGYGTPAYSYKIDSEFADANETKNNLKFTTHMILVSDANGCSDTMSFYMAPPPIFIPDFFTPNGDGINDSWIPANLKEIYPEAVVSIYDRFGKKLAEYKAADPDWDGTYKGKDMPTTDYWYEIEIEEIDKQYVGHFTLLRR
jgi:gliding motility-associated-like protein